MPSYIGDYKMAKQVTQADIKKSQVQLNQAFVQIMNTEYTMRREAIQRLLNPNKDINYECGYPDDINKTDYKAIYEREGLAKKVVRMLPEDSWAEPPDIFEDENADNKTQFEEAWELLQDKFNILQYMQRIDILSGIGRYGVLLLGINDGKKLEEPVDGINLETGEKSGNKNYELIYLKAIDESTLEISRREDNTASPRYGLPTMYDVQFENPVGNTITKVGAKVHWTRIIHVADNRDTSDIFGVPRMKPVYNRLLDLRKVLSGSGEMFWKGGFPGYTAEIDPTIAPSVMADNTLRDTIATNLREQIEDWQNSMQRILAVAGMKFTSLQPQVADPEGHVTTHLKVIAISLGIPYRIFMGTEEAKLASSQDVKTYNKRLTNRQNYYITPFIIRPIIDRLIMYGVLPEPKEYTVTWSEMDTLSESDNAEIIAKKTESLAKYVTGGVEEIVPKKYYLTEFLDIDDKLADEMLVEVNEQEKNIDEEEVKKQMLLDKQNKENENVT